MKHGCAAAGVLLAVTQRHDSGAMYPILYSFNSKFISLAIFVGMRLEFLSYIHNLFLLLWSLQPPRLFVKQGEIETILPDLGHRSLRLYH
jgi:hypothetical protein